MTTCPSRSSRASCSPGSARRRGGRVAKQGHAPSGSPVGTLVIDTTTMQVTVGDRSVSLTTSEFALLHALAQRPGRVLGREQLLQLLHGSSEEAFDRSIDVHISRLRHKLGDDPRHPRMLKTVRGAGYMLTPNEARDG